jgi:glycosyltransferase involved in cell wall biosynthesis
MTTPDTLVSIIIPTCNEEKFIGSVLDTILLQDYPRNRIEIVVVDGHSDDNTKNIVSEYSLKYNCITLLNNPDRLVSHGLNLGIKHSHGEVIVRMDAHALYPEKYLSTLIRYLFDLNADNVGAVIETIPSNNSTTARVIAYALGSPFGVGSSYFRIGINKITRVDTVPFGCYRRDVFSRIGYFDEDLVRNQDDEFNARLINNGGKIYLIPDIKIKYFARDSLAKLSSMFFQYGYFKPLVNKKLGSPATLRQFFPLGFFISLVVSACVMLFSFPVGLSFIVGILGLYLSTALFFTIGAIINSGNAGFILLPYVFFIIHSSYGYGYLKGIFHLLVAGKFPRVKSIKMNR